MTPTGPPTGPPIGPPDGPAGARGKPSGENDPNRLARTVGKLGARVTQAFTDLRDLRDDFTRHVAGATEHAEEVDTHLRHLSTRATGLATTVSGAFDRIRDLQEAVKALQSKPAGGGDAEEDPLKQAWDWSLIERDSEEWHDRWEQLREWVGRVPPFYWDSNEPGTPRYLPPCWDQHWGVVLELTTLCVGWYAAFNAKDRKPVPPMEFLDRWNDNAWKRIQGDIGTCKSAGHVDRDEFRAIAARWADPKPATT
jgi:hypothetical protein